MPKSLPPAYRLCFFTAATHAGKLLVPCSADKEYNLGLIEQMSLRAAENGAEVIAFHECSITGYTFARHLSEREMLDIAERQKVAGDCEKTDLAILAGLFGKGENKELYKAYVCVDKNGLVAKHRKLHPFINPYLKKGDAYTVFEIKGWKCGILICYDNNIIENVRAATLLGAEIIFMPHVTRCTPSTRPGAGFVDKKLWDNRIDDPTSLRIEFEGLKGRAWR